MHKLFLDANILFAAAYSANGGSALIFELANKKNIKIVSSKIAFLEAERNLINKGSKEAMITFYNQISYLDYLYEEINQQNKKYFEKIINKKDVDILANAVNSKSNFLITLDRKDFFQKKVFDFASPMIICTPAEYLQKHLTI